MDLKKFFCKTGTLSLSGRRGENAEHEVSTGSYADMLGLNRNFNFFFLKNKVTDQTDFDTVAKAAKDLLKQDLMRFGESFYEIEPALRNKLMGTIGSMTLIAADDGTLSVKFHRRDEDGLWDGISKKFPEKETTGKYKYEVFFSLDDEEEYED